MNVRLHPGAESDLSDAFDFYLETAGTVIASRFLDEFQRTVRLIVENPEAGVPLARGRRSFPLRVFPFSVVYLPLNENLVILVVRHQHRMPGYGARRNPVL